MVSSVADNGLDALCIIGFFIFVHYVRKWGIARIKELKECDEQVRYNDNNSN